MRVLLMGRQDPATKKAVQELGANHEVTWACRLDDVNGPADVLIYAAAWMRADSVPPDKTEIDKHLDAVRSVAVARVIVLSSGAIHTPRFAHSGMVPEVPARIRDASPLARRWIALEQAVGSLACAVVIVRLAPLAYPLGTGFFSRMLGRRLALTPMGHDPPVQLLHPDDLARALVALVESDLVGVVNLVPRSTIPLRRALKTAGTLRIPFPRLLLGLFRGPKQRHAIARIRYTATINGDRALRELGWEAEHSSEQTARSVRADARQLEVKPDYDDFGWERGYTDRMRATLFRFLHDNYWRVSYRGIEHVPKSGRAILVGIHRGFMPFDGTTVLYETAREVGRYPRFLIHPCLIKPAFLADYIRRIGGVVACRDNGDRLLQAGHLVGIYPEGIEGAFTLYRDAYRLGDFGRDEYVKMALRNRAPIVPFVTLGSAEIFPIYGRIDWRWAKRYFGWPYIPVTTPVMLPSKWHTLYLQPYPVQEWYGPEAADNPEIVGKLGAMIKARMAETLAEMLGRRRHVFWGRIFDGWETGWDPDPTRCPGA